MDAIVYDKVGKEAEKVREALYGIYPQETITDAAIASFDDGADGIPVKALTVGIEPVQDLHGFENPWPAGAYTLFSFGAGRDGYAWSDGCGFGDIKASDSSILLNGTATSNHQFSVQGASFVLPAGTYTSSLTRYGVVTVTLVNDEATIKILDSAVTFTLSAQRSISASFTIMAGASFDNERIGIQINSGTTAVPYSNECPISGWTGAEISGTGVNVWDEEWEVGSIYDDNGLNNNSRTDVIRSKNYIPVKPSSIYWYNMSQSYVFMYDADRNFVKVVFAPDKTTLTIPANCYYIRFRLYPSYGTTYNHDISINYPATDTEYHPYTGDQISVTFPSEAGTVYGGTLTINSDRTGTLVVDSAMVTFDGSDDEAWLMENSATAGTNFYIAIQNFAPNQTSQNSGLISNIAPAVPEVGARQGYVFVSIRYCNVSLGDILGITDVATWKTYLSNNPVQVLYDLENPITIPLTESEISGILETLYGTNNIWANTGNIEKLTYRADLGKYIDSHITTAVANALNA